eukprot:1195826-Prorocentrum_minimum.AAC.8
MYPVGETGRTRCYSSSYKSGGALPTARLQHPGEGQCSPGLRVAHDNSGRCRDLLCHDAGECDGCPSGISTLAAPSCRE